MNDNIGKDNIQLRLLRVVEADPHITHQDMTRICCSRSAGVSDDLI